MLKLVKSKMDIQKQSRNWLDHVASVVEKTGKQVANQASTLTDGKTEEVTEEAIQAAVDKAIDVLKIASEKVKEKNINGERVTLEIDVEVLGVARLKIKTDVPENKEQSAV